jgi:hypothetical protein
MAIGAVTVLTFVWSYVIPVLRDGVKVINKGTYKFIKNRVDDADILELSGLEKRTTVYTEAVVWLQDKGVDTTLYSSALIYLLLEIAVANLKKKQKRLVRTG